MKYILWNIADTIDSFSVLLELLAEWIRKQVRKPEAKRERAMEFEQ